MTIGDERLATIFELQAAGRSEVRTLLSSVGSTMDDLGDTATKLRKKMGQLSDLDAVEGAIRRLDTGFDSAKESGDRLDGGLGNLGASGFAKVGLAAGAATLAVKEFIDVSVAAFEIGQQGAAALDVADAFERLGGTAEQLESLAKATANYADETTLQTILNIAAGYGQTAEEVELLSSAVVAVGQDTNRSQEEIRASLETTIKGFGKFSDEALEGLGITIAEVNDRLAETVPNLTDLAATEQLAAKQTAALAIVAERNLTPAMDSAGARFAEAQTNIDNFVSELQVFVAELFLSTDALEVMQDATEQIAEVFRENQDAIKELAEQGIALLIEMLPVVLATMEKLAPVLDVVPFALTLIEDGFRRMISPIDLFIGAVKTVGGTLGILITSHIKPFIVAAEAVADALGLDIADDLSDASDALDEFAEDSLATATEGLGQFGQGVLDSTAGVSIATREIRNAAEATDDYSHSISNNTGQFIDNTDQINLNIEANRRLSQMAKDQTVEAETGFKTGEARTQIAGVGDLLHEVLEFQNTFSERVEDFGTEGAREEIDRLLAQVFDLDDAAQAFRESEGIINPNTEGIISKVNAELGDLLDLNEKLLSLENPAKDAGAKAAASVRSGARDATVEPLTVDELFMLVTGLTTEMAAESFGLATDDFIAKTESILETKSIAFEVRAAGQAGASGRVEDAAAETEGAREEGQSAALAMVEEMAALDAADTAAQVDELTASMQGLVSTIAGTGEGDSTADALAAFSEGISSTTDTVITQLALIEEGGLSAGGALKGGLGIAKAGIGAFAGAVIKDTKALAAVQGLFEIAEAGAALARFIGSYGADGVQLASFAAHGLAAAAYFKAAGSGGGGGGAARGAAGGAGKKPKPTFNESGDRPLLQRQAAQKLAPIFIVNDVRLSTEQVAGELNKFGRQDRGFTFNSNLVDQNAGERF